MYIPNHTSLSFQEFMSSQRNTSYKNNFDPSSSLIIFEKETNIHIFRRKIGLLTYCWSKFG
jgi:hypothetical protein